MQEDAGDFGAGDLLGQEPLIVAEPDQDVVLLDPRVPDGPAVEVVLVADSLAQEVDEALRHLPIPDSDLDSGEVPGNDPGTEAVLIPVGPLIRRIVGLHLLACRWLLLVEVVGDVAQRRLGNRHDPPGSIVRQGNARLPVEPPDEQEEVLTVVLVHEQVPAPDLL